MKRFWMVVALLLAASVQAQGTPAKSGPPAAVKMVSAAQLPGMPIIHQGYNQCGPASLQMVLAYWGLGMDQVVIGSLTKPSPRAYMSVQAIGGFASSIGLASTTVRGASLQMIRSLVAQGIPVIALSYYDTVGVVPHWRVVSGFDDRQGVVFVHDPLAGYIAIRYQDFETLRVGLGNIIAAVYPQAFAARARQAISD
ncbi:C39 family peptidase [Deinococcus ruber]|uniref:Peptidase C39 domain-containing protein n=1 Tax=Deinococcus ruber TaxID=1848197 RepID=A0A918F8B4_9DEIO|nr:C39 family peptidase [Deinococcus ruber]GGR09920.1 hypothetical protein GCM10008957_23360 [Deinococcus ruber]